MAIEKSGIWTAIVTTEWKLTHGLPVAAVPSGTSLAGAGRSLGPAVATLVAVLTLITGTAPALAQNGGLGSNLGVPDVNLGLSKLQGAGVGVVPFVPVPGIHVTPGLMRGPLANGGVTGIAAPGVSGLIPLNGLTGSGFLATPSLPLGPVNGALPTVQVLVQPVTGLTSGYRDGMGVAQGALQAPVAASDRIAARPYGGDRDASRVGEASPRQLPTCR